MSIIVQPKRSKGIIIGRDHTGVIVRPRAKIGILAHAKQGVPGRNGTGDKTYLHDQMVAASTWTINHNLAKYPCITVVDSGGSQIEGDVNFTDPNQAIIIFTAAFAGRAFCN